MSFLRPNLLRLAGFSLAVGLVAFAGCTSSGTTPIPVTHPTMISVDPEELTSLVPCSLEGPGLKRYVATLVDRDFGEGGAPMSNEDIGENGGYAPLGGAQGFESPSSLPTPCDTGVGFGFVVAGRHYEVLIDGYDTDAIEPRSPGAPEMVPTDAASDAVHTDVLLPRWQAKCSQAIAVDLTVVQATHCTPLAPTEP